ncbi:UDP-N-acetylglucosamine 2-epimerase [Cupriavidus gilardii]|uniref:UDP-N-acetylglucosamine 2-epimerase n=1 Tax=Cupriavidus gilardii TaxID=82541 RepID=UPI0021B1E030|nr:UDP-N-acetylglucosamine 2-epimerase [Cupriavidus gilardii]UXC36799.1 UDP-N-acetylglucosamine 2-epimerase [Cupriavidus gilardii]
MKKVLFVTGTRADFGKIKRLMHYINDHPNMDLHVLVTGMHMLKRYGATHLEVRKEGFENIYTVSNQHLGEPMCSVLGNTVSLVSRVAKEIGPDLIVVHGDRLEALAGATVGALSNTLVCHIEGGELSGTVDDLIRHSVSKLAHIHMVANAEARTRLLQMGENPSSIHIIGSPDLDVMTSSDLPSKAEALEHYGIDFERYAIAMFHPVTTEEDQMQAYADQFFAALELSQRKYVVVYPNNDTGSDYIIDAIETRCAGRKERFAVFPSIRFEYFLTLLKNAEFIIGNSSAGIREAPFYGVPTVNVGSRQSRRFFGRSIFNCEYDVKKILEAIALAADSGAIEPSTQFGDGRSVEKFAAALEQETFWETPVQKTFFDLV